MRFASAIFDKYSSQLAGISDFRTLDRWMDEVDIERQFLDFASSKDGLRPSSGEWEASKAYMMPQLKALVGRYSKLDDEAFYRFYTPVDDALQRALALPSVVE